MNTTNMKYFFQEHFEKDSIKKEDIYSDVKELDVNNECTIRDSFIEYMNHLLDTNCFYEFCRKI